MPSVQTHKLSTLTLPWTPNWTAVFDTPDENRPLIVELGFGYGQMLFHLAEQHPEANVIGVEIASKPLETVERRIIRRGVANIRVVYGYAETFLQHLLEPESVQEIHVNFPDPWFKSGHHRRRLMKRATVDAITSRLVVGGHFYLATDIDDYAEMSNDLLVDTLGLSNRFDTPWSNTIDNRVITKYERKALREGRTNKYFAYRRTDHPIPPVPVIREQPMPNLVFQSKLDWSQFVQTFERTSASFEGDIHVSLIHAYEGAQGVLIEAFVKEPTIEQHVGFLIVPRQQDPSAYTLKLASFGYPRPTEGMHRATLFIEQVIRERDPAYAAVHRKIRE